ncbi:MAG: hypothetical protein K8Q91_03775 [Candidatus Vogelbacteria bacterium]|nr:hypothetical protein [Candidatus Vogelbacteria bacterium]
MKSRLASSIKFVSICLLLGGVFWAQLARATNFAGEIIRIVREPEYIAESLSPSLLEYFREFQASQERQDLDGALRAIQRLTTELTAEPTSDAYTYCMGYRALLEETANRHSEAIQTLERLRTARSDLQGIEIRYLADLEVARIMLDNGGNPNLPDFTPSFEDVSGAVNRVFSNYDAYQYDVILMHVKYANDVIEKGIFWL